MEHAKMLKVNQVAKFLQMNRMTIYKLVKSGKLPGVKIGSEWRFDKDKLQDWLNGHTGIKRPQGRISKKTQKEKVLIVDDDPGIRDLFIKLLKDDGQKVYIASSGKECMELIKEYNPNVVLLDLKMADIDGIDTLRLIKSYNKKIAVIVITAYATMNTAIEAMKLGAYDYIAKPFDNDKIIALVRKAVKTTK
ncbi:MAG: response regulator [Candidatus Omnitrophota bacterium]